MFLEFWEHLGDSTQEKGKEERFGDFLVRKGHIKASLGEVFFENKSSQAIQHFTLNAFLQTRPKKSWGLFLRDVLRAFPQFGLFFGRKKHARLLPLLVINGVITSIAKNKWVCLELFHPEISVEFFGPLLIPP